MASRKTSTTAPVSEYRYDSKRKNNPPAGLAAQGRVQETPKLKYSYDPHLPPALRFDETGASDRAAELLSVARERALTSEETKEISELLRNREPWLEWTGKQEAKGFVVDPVALHIHERVSTQAILRAVQREDTQKDLFADPQQEYREAVQFYKHDVDWSNRMILGDSLQVMASLARREDLAGKVQMIYLDPPYGIRFASNFQPEIGRRDVKDKEQDLTREPEMVKAYRDTWTLGVHSYLAYLRDRLILSREMLTDSGSIFVQIGDENVHRVRAVMDEVFGPKNHCGDVVFVKTSGLGSSLLADRFDVLLWYAKDVDSVKYNQLYVEKSFEEGTATNYGWLELDSGERRGMKREEKLRRGEIPNGARVYKPDNITSQGNPIERFEHFGKPYSQAWKTNAEGRRRLTAASRMHVAANSLQYVRYLSDFSVLPITKLWTDTATGSFTDEKIYVVQTGTKTIERCVLLSTDPGDLVLDPTCGSGTTALVAEQWGRRWITTDTSRVALALARQRLMTATFAHYKVRTGDEANPANGFVYKTVPHITLKSIAQNVALDPIFTRHQPLLDATLAALNGALKAVTPELRKTLKAKLAAKQKAEGKRSITDADRRRWELPSDAWHEWEVPFDTDPDWPAPLQRALTEYRSAWRAKMDEVNQTIAASAEQEELVDQPEVVRNVTRVSGPFTVEAVMPAEQSLEEETGFDGAAEELDAFDADGGHESAITTAAPAGTESFRDTMLRLLRQDGVRFPDNREMHFSNLEPAADHLIHAEGEWANGDGQARRVAVSFGPEHGPVTAYQVEEAIRAAYRRGYDDLVFAGFSFDATAQATIQEDENPKLRCHLAHIAPSVQMGDLLKTTPSSQLFTVFGSPRTTLKPAGDGQFTVTMDGVDIYDPVANTIHPTRADKVAAWFVDTDYDGRTFCIAQAFFPDRKAWGKIARALRGTVDESAWEALSGKESLPFPGGKHRRVAVKVIDPRGNEVMRVHRLDAAAGY